MTLAIDPDVAVTYLDFVAERHRVWEHRQRGHEQPWTDDPTLASRKFTNVYRVLDPGSQFIFDLDDSDPLTTLARIIGYRYTNLPSAWEAYAEVYGTYPMLEDWANEFPSFLMERQAAGHRVFSGAYIILPEPNHSGDKAKQSCNLVVRVMLAVGPQFIEATSQEERFNLLVSQFGVGQFLAMQILTDWGYTRHVTVDHENDFVVAGPGAQKGAAALLGIPHTAKKNWVVPAVAREVIDWAQKAVWAMGADCPMLWHNESIYGPRRPSLMDIQNTLCELSKYVKGPRASTYTAAHPGAQPEPRIPSSWDGRLI